MSYGKVTGMSFFPPNYPHSLPTGAMIVPVSELFRLRSVGHEVDVYLADYKHPTTKHGTWVHADKFLEDAARLHGRASLWYAPSSIMVVARYTPSDLCHGTPLVMLDDW
jgi:hypothetical protein